MDEKLQQIAQAGADDPQFDVNGAVSLAAAELGLKFFPALQEVREEITRILTQRLPPDRTVFFADTAETIHGFYERKRRRKR